MEKQTNIPSLRFPEFKGEWEAKKLGEISKINPSNKNLPDKFIYIDLESVVNGELLKENEILKSEAPSRAQRLLTSNDILFQMVRPYQMNNLFFSKSGEYVSSTGYAQIRTIQNPRFLYQYLHFQKFVDKVIERCTGTSYPAINSNDLSNITINFPSLSEQTKISNFLTSVDEKLQALKQKKTLLEQYKKGVMQQIFSVKTDGRRSIRFKDDNGNDFADWEEKSLGELNIDIKSGKDKNIDSGTIPLFGSTGIIGNCLKNSFEGNYILIARVGANAGKINLVDGRFGVTDNTLVIANNININTVFLYNTLIKQNLNQFVFGSGQPLITGGHLKALPLNFPSLPEQTKIANFLSAIDDKINHCQSQIEKTEIWKKGLLQGMFV